jgi:branched-chain amino acid transport system substrate-binding protein
MGREVEFVIYDDETDVNKCVLATDKLIKKDRVTAVLGPSISGNTLAIMNKFPKAKIPLVSCAASEKIVKPVNPWVFKTPQSDRHAVTKILEHAGEKGFKDLAIITVSNGYGQSGRAVLKELIPEMGFSLAADEVYGPKDTDMTAQLTKIKGKNPDAIVCWGTNPGPAVICRNRVQLGIEAPLYQSHGVASKKFIELAGEAAEGVMLPAGHIIVANRLPDDHPQKDVLVEYVNAYEKRYGAPPSAFGGYAWDAAHLVFSAIEKGGTTDPESIRDNLEKIDRYVGASGIFNFSAKDHNGLTKDAFIMVEIEDGDWQIIE